MQNWYLIIIALFFENRKTRDIPVWHDLVCVWGLQEVALVCVNGLHNSDLFLTLLGCGGCTMTCWTCVCTLATCGGACCKHSLNQYLGDKDKRYFIHSSIYYRSKWRDIHNLFTIFLKENWTQHIRETEKLVLIILPQLSNLDWFEKWYMYRTL